MRKLISCLAAALLASAAGTAHAEWHVAKSKHFIIYANQRPQQLLEYATRVEKFDQAVRRAMHMEDMSVGDGNRLTIFVVASEGAVQKLANNKNVGGFYVPRASGPLAFVPQRVSWSDGTGWNQETIFFHEYAHHLMLQDLQHPYPEWLVEGFAELMSTARFERDGSVLLGAAAQHRAPSLVYGTPLPLETLLSGNYGKLSAQQRVETVYARGWLLTHYLTFEPKRAGQTARYLAAIANGTPPLAAATAAFGDLKTLDRDLSAYLRRGSLSAIRISGEKVQPGPIDVKPLTPGAALVLPLRIRSKRGVDRTTAEPLAVEVRKVQARFPGDELVEVTLAEAEFDARHPEAAEAAADRALKANPRNTEALIYKGRAIARRAESLSGPARKAAFELARRTFIAANKIDAEDPEPLLDYYRSFLSEGVPPTPNAIEALHYASDLVPQDVGLRLNSAIQYLRDGDLKLARRTLAPIAFNPHAGKMADTARAIMAKVDAGDAPAALKLVDEPANGASAATPN